jgi:hypothetical protein
MTERDTTPVHEVRPTTQELRAGALVATIRNPNPELVKAAAEEEHH